MKIRRIQKEEAAMRQQKGRFRLEGEEEIRERLYGGKKKIDNKRRI
jgi:hypothetical protein